MKPENREYLRELQTILHKLLNVFVNDWDPDDSSIGWSKEDMKREITEMLDIAEHIGSMKMMINKED